MVKHIARQIAEKDVRVAFLKDLSLDQRSRRQMTEATFKFVSISVFEYSAKLICVLNQITGCLNPSLFHFAPNDKGGQFDVRFPNGAQCTYGGYGASFIELYVFSVQCFASNTPLLLIHKQSRACRISLLPSVLQGSQRPEELQLASGRRWMHQCCPWAIHLWKRGLFLR